MPQIVPTQELKNTSAMSEMYRDLEISEREFAEGKGKNAFDAVAETRAKYGL